MSVTNVLRPVSVDFLYPGLLVRDSIYNFDTSKMLLPGGRVLNGDIIDRIVNTNQKKPWIYISENTYNDIRRNSRDIGNIVTVDGELESKTGYTNIVSNASDMMTQIRDNGYMSKEAVYSVSREVAQRLRITKPDIVFDIINALAPADEYLRRHVVNVSMLNGLIGRWLGLPENEINMLIVTGLVHDCGKAIIPREILNAPRKLSLVEMEVMKTHPSYSYILLNGLPESIREGALHHHEKINGKGYPGNLCGKAIILASRVTSVSDVYDAMVSRRVYKKPMSPFKVLTVLLEMRGKDLDAYIVDLFIKKIPGELAGKQVLLSNGETGVVKNADFNDLEHPFVSLNGKVIKTDDDIFCLSML